MDQVKDILNQLTLEEKTSLCSGRDMWHTKEIERLGVPSIMLADGPHGLRKQTHPDDPLGESVPATCFPTASALAASWDRKLVQEVGAALGEEALQEGVSVILGPGCNIKRSPLCGRNFEYFSEDPYLSGEMAKSHIRGVQSKGIGTALKHFAANNQERRRMSINAVIDERALHEIYLRGFEIAVRGAQPWAVMSAYNQINGTFCSENADLLSDLLKRKWGHEGIVLTDWGAMNQRVKAMLSGCELEMPGLDNGNDALLTAAIREGRLDESNLDGAVERLLTLIFRAQENRRPGFAYDPEAHHALARRAAAEGAVLLKNSGGLLPLRRDTRVAVAGRFAKEPRFQGAGSSYINPSLLDHAYDEMEKLAAPNSLGYAPGYTAHADLPEADLICKAMRLARDAEVAVIFAGLPERYEVEGLDREHMHLPPGQDALIEAVAASNPQTVVVLSNGSPVEMPWAGRVSAILEGYLGGQAGGGGTADILYGEVNPGGKLPETFPLHLEDNPSYLHFPGGTKTVEYRESLYVGYRFYDSVEKDVLFPFGHGLSYTTFEFNSLSFSAESLRDREPLSVYLNVRNTGAVAGAEVVQVYVHDVESTAYRPKKELKGFEKVVLQPGQTAEVCINLDWRAFACYDPALKAWVVEPGDFDILIGASSRDIRLTGRVTVMLDKNTSLTRSSGPAAYHHFPDDADVLREDFAALLGRALPAAEFTVGEAYTINTSIEDMQATFFGRLLGRFFKRRIHAMIGPDQDSPNALLLKAVAAEAPLRTFMMAGNGITYALLEGLVLLINGKIWPGLKAVLAARKVVRR